MEGNGHHEAVGTIEAAVQSSERDATPLPDVAVVIEQEQPPCAVNYAWLLESTH